MQKIAKTFCTLAFSLACGTGFCGDTKNNARAIEQTMASSKYTKDAETKHLPFKKEEGMFIQINDGNKIWLSVQNKSFVICYLNSKDELIAPAHTSASVMYNCKKTKQRLVNQLSSNGKYLSSNIILQRPYIFSAVAIKLGEKLLPGFSYTQTDSSGESIQK